VSPGRPDGWSPSIAVTSGEPAGIGPELCAALLSDPLEARLTIIGDRRLLERAAGRPLPDERILQVPLLAPSVPGRLDPQNAPYVLALLDAGIDGCRAGRFDALVTAPVHKGVINDAGIPFTGHTEYLAARCGAELPVMMLVGGGLRVALATTHLPLSKVSAALTADRLEQVIRVLEADLRAKFAIAAPRILVCGLNPHAGEGGHLGREEIEVIAPVLERLRAEGLGLTGPVPADTAFLPERLAGHDLSRFAINRRTLEGMKADAMILHPLPRTVEIDKAIDDDPRAHYFQQARNGLFVRMALLTMIWD